MKKRIFICVLAAAAVAVGCRKDRVEANPEFDPLDDGKPVAVTFSSNVLNVKTRASLTGLNDSHDLYIYGLNRSKPGVGEIINAKAHMAKPSGAGTDWLVAEGALEFADDKTFFYNGTRDVYDFYGYYVGDAATVPETLPDYQLEVAIDGSQDVLIGIANPEEDITATGVDTDEVKDTENVYSAWSTRRGVTPKIKFIHALTQYKFEVKNRGTQAVVLQSVEITSKTNGVLTVVNQDPSAPGADDGLVQGFDIKPGDTDKLISLKSSTFTQGGAVLDYKGEGPDDDVKVDGVRLEPLQTAPVKLEGELMTFAGQTNNVIVKLVQKGMKPGEFRQITLPITLNETENLGTKTRPGYSYLISLVIYSLEEAGMNVSLVEWHGAGSIPLDQEVEAGKPGTGYEDKVYDDGI